MSLLQLELEQQAVDHQQSPMHRSESLPSGIVAEHCGAIQMTRDATGRSEDGILAVEMNRSPLIIELRQDLDLDLDLDRYCNQSPNVGMYRFMAATHIDTLEGQLKDEVHNSHLLREELEASRKLCCKLHETCSRGDVARSVLNVSQSATTTESLPVKHKSVQTLLTTDNENGCARQPLCREQIKQVRVSSAASQYKEARIAEEYQDKISDLQQECKERDYQVMKITHQLSEFIHRSTKLEAEQVSLKDNLRRANNRVKSREEQLVQSQKLLEKTMLELDTEQECKTSSMKKCAKLEEQSAEYEHELAELTEELSLSNHKCRQLNRRILLLNDSLDDKRGEVSQKETDLETKNTILEAIKTIAYTSPSPRPGSCPSHTPRTDHSFSSYTTPTRAQRNIDHHSVIEQRTQLLTHRPHPPKTSNQPSPCYSYTADDLHNSESSNSFVESQQSDKQMCDGDSSSDASSQYQSTVCESLNSEGLDADDEGGLDVEEECCEADLQEGGGGERAVKYGVEAEGLLLRKHEQENYAMRSRNRSWHYVYIVQHGTLLWFYETRDHKIRGKTLHNEQPVDLMDAYVTVALDYKQKKHVFRVQLSSGQQYIFQARDDREMLYWVCCMDSAARCQTAQSNGIPPSIGTVAEPQMGSPSKSDRIKRVIKSSLSALKK
ncbi:uncharacterized protein LOC117296178 [Asterias rubens]|uniref:uncharacterized protein LOC117296178 n=1 Tax=Asterias rubens TaxID=7604 RepID=UPI001455136A|nr:uncharacterized protein LOC117296178 [Asterias rubens]